jgi:hypothetical protein
MELRGNFMKLHLSRWDLEAVACVVFDIFKRCPSGAKEAAEKGLIVSYERKKRPSGAKAPVIFSPFMYGLKPVPFKTRACLRHPSTSLRAGFEVVP